MYALVGVWNLDPARHQEQDRNLQELIIPSARSHPGFLAGYWMRDPKSGKGHSTILLDNEPAAQAFKEIVLGNTQSRRLRPALPTTHSPSLRCLRRVQR
jgi:hypothetical protein